MSVDRNLKCSADFEGTIIRTFNDYLESQDDSNKFTAGGGFSAGFGVGYKASVKYQYSQSKQFEDEKKGFTDQESEIVRVMAECLTFCFLIEPNIRPKFNKGFINGLVKLDNSLTMTQGDQENAAIK